MAIFKAFAASGVDMNDLFMSAENIDQEALSVTSTRIRAVSDYAIGASRFDFIGRGLDVDGTDLDGTVTEIRFYQGATEVARLSNASISAQALGDAIADSAEETGFEPLLDLFSKLTYRYVGGVGDDGFTGGLKNDVISGGGGADRLSGEQGADLIKGGVGDDVLSGDYGLSTSDFDRGGADTVYGGSGDDNIRGDGGSDLLFGDAGDDVLTGGSGRDRFVGGAGSDRMFGGEGADTFIFKTAGDSPYFRDELDEISDFTHKVDKIDLRAIDAQENVKGNQAFKFVGEVDNFTRSGQVALIASGADFYVACNTDQDSDVEFGFFVNFVNAGALTKGDFLL